MKSSQDSSRFRYRRSGIDSSREPRVRRACEAGASGRAVGAGSLLVFGVAEVPLEQEVLPLGVADDPLAVAAELGSCGRQELEAGQRPGPELLAVARSPKSDWTSQCGATGPR